MWNYYSIPLLKPVPGDCAPDYMVVIPARNEALFVGAAVQSLPHDSVIVVDDHSGDGSKGWRGA